MRLVYLMPRLCIFPFSFSVMWKKKPKSFYYLLHYNDFSFSYFFWMCNLAKSVYLSNERWGVVDRNELFFFYYFIILIIPFVCVFFVIIFQQVNLVVWICDKSCGIKFFGFFWQWNFIYINSMNSGCSTNFSVFSMFLKFWKLDHEKRSWG